MAHHVTGKSKAGISLHQFQDRFLPPVVCLDPNQAKALMVFTDQVLAFLEERSKAGVYRGRGCGSRANTLVPIGPQFEFEFYHQQAHQLL